MKKLLMICYYFPPIGAVASQRPAKFAKYLQGFGWEPVVVTRKGDPLYHTDESFLKDIKNIKIHRILSDSILTRALGIMSLAKLDFVKKFLAFPDTYYDSIFLSLQRLIKLIEKENPDVIWISAVPTTLALFVPIVKKITNKPVIVDFHNEWTRYMYYKPATNLHNKVMMKMEARVVLSADAVITLNPWHTSDLKQRFSNQEIYTIENGYDSEDFILNGNRQHKEFTLTYAGALYGYQKINNFLSLLNESGLDTFVNVLGDTFGEYENLKYNFKINYARNVSHSELWKYYSSSDAFFLELDEGAFRQLPTKLYEYIQTGRPVLAKVPNNSIAAEFIRKNECGFIIKTSDDIKQAIAEIKSGFEINKEKIKVYDRQNLTAKLAVILDSLLTPQISIRKYPYPYKCAVAISSDMDECTMERYEEIKQIFRNVPISKHCLVFNNNPYFSDQINLVDNQDLASDPGFSLHTYGDFNYKGGFTREHAVETKKIMDKVGASTTVWVNHGDKKNIQNIGFGQGDVINNPSYHVDIMKKLGIRFIWNYELTNMIGQDTPSPIHDIVNYFPFFARKKGFLPDNDIIHPTKLRDGTNIYSFVRYGEWSRSQAYFFGDIINYKTLGKLCSKMGTMIAYIHLGVGVFRNDIYKAVEALKTDSIWVDYIDRILIHRVMRENLKFNSYIRGNDLYIEIKYIDDPVLGVFKPNRNDLRSLTFYYKGDFNIKVLFEGEMLRVNYNQVDQTGKRSFTII